MLAIRGKRKRRRGLGRVPADLHGEGLSDKKPAVCHMPRFAFQRASDHEILLVVLDSGFPRATANFFSREVADLLGGHDNLQLREDPKYFLLNSRLMSLLLLWLFLLLLLWLPCLGRLAAS